MPNLTPPLNKIPLRPVSTLGIRPPVAVKPAVVVKPAPVKTPVPTYPKGLVRTLCIGVNYTTIPSLQLYGCINDAINIQILMRKFYPNCKDHTLITDDTTVKPTRENILKAIDLLVKDLKPGQNVFFHYSGHGGRIPDQSKDEVTGMDSCIHPYSGSVVETISDDELRQRLSEKIPVGCKCFAVLDSCHSGTAMDLRYNWQCDQQKRLSFIQDEKYQKTRGSVVFLSGCQDVQYSMDTVNAQGVPGGALTFALLSTWNKYKFQLKIKHLLWDVREYLKTMGYEQIPQISTGTSMSSEDTLDLSK
jgi:hypothetical protein